MQFFAENTLDEVLLCSLGMDGKESRVRLIGFFESVLCITRTDVVASFSEFIRCLAQKVAELEDLRARILVLQGHVDGLHAASLSVGSELEALRSRVLLSDSRASELSTINDQLKVALEAYKEKVGKYKRHALEKDETIRTLRAEMESYDRRLSKCLADASTADTLSSARVKEMEIKWSRSLLRQRALARRVSFFRREIGKVKTHWTKWSGRSAILGRRCGCGQSIRYFERTRIDLEWITEEAARASAGFQVELKTTAEAMRAEIQVVHDERDDALADCSVYIDRLLLSDKELRRSIIRNSELLAELSVVKAEFARRGGSDRALLKAQLFAGAGGRALVCPVPTVDGELVQVADVYRGWMVSGGSGGGCGLGAGFVSPLSGTVTTLTSPGFICLIFRMACVLGVDMTLPFKVQYSTDSVVWMDLPFVDQLSVVSRICHYASTRTDNASDRISVLSSMAYLCLQLVDCELAACVERVGTGPVSRGSVRMTGVGSFFSASHILFASGIDPST